MVIADKLLLLRHLNTLQSVVAFYQANKVVNSWLDSSKRVHEGVCTAITSSRSAKESETATRVVSRSSVSSAKYSILHSMRLSFYSFSKIFKCLNIFTINCIHLFVIRSVFQTLQCCRIVLFTPFLSVYL